MTEFLVYLFALRYYIYNKGKGHFIPLPSIPPARGGKFMVIPIAGKINIVSLSTLKGVEGGGEGGELK